MVRFLVNILLFLFSLSAFSQENETQQLIITYSPQEALILIDDEMIESSNGEAIITLSQGKHTYSVMANGYEPQKGSVILKKSSPSKLIVQLQLKDGMTIQNSQGVMHEGLHEDENMENSQKTTSVRITNIAELSYIDIRDNISGIFVCDGNKWSTNIDLIHKALQDKKMECKHSPMYSNLHAVKKNKSKYVGVDVDLFYYGDLDGVTEYFVGVSGGSKKRAMKCSEVMFHDFAANGVTFTQTDKDVTELGSLVLYFLSTWIPVSAIYCAEDNINRYIYFEGKISSIGSYYSHGVIVLKKITK